MSRHVVMENLFTAAAREVEETRLIAYKVIYTDDEGYHEVLFALDDLAGAERLMYEKKGSITGVRKEEMYG